ncbi:MAG: ribosome small subunit-dependent GTPase A [Planctomycetota bacterium]
MSLEAWGVTTADRAALAALDQPTWHLARVADERRDRWRVLLDHGEALAEPSGRLRHAALSADDLPAVGDVVAVSLRHGEDRVTLHAILPRRSVLRRKQAGRGSGSQLLATNVDIVVIAMALDDDWNPRRLERYLAFAWDSGASPLVVLTKSDLAPDAEARRDEAQALSPGTTVLAVCARDGVGVEAVAEALSPRQTAVVVGSSGVGKSTLLNALLGEQRQVVTPVRDRDQRGQHTTTQRSLFALPGGALLIDTPGMRELGLIADDEALEAAFADLEALAAECRFRDCQHASEPGCAVAAAIEAGELDPERVASWRRLEREAAWQRRKANPLARIAEQRRWKQIGQAGKRRSEEKRGG